MMQQAQQQCDNVGTHGLMTAVQALRADTTHLPRGCDGICIHPHVLAAAADVEGHTHHLHTQGTNVCVC